MSLTADERPGMGAIVEGTAMQVRSGSGGLAAVTSGPQSCGWHCRTPRWCQGLAVAAALVVAAGSIRGEEDGIWSSLSLSGADAKLPVAAAVAAAGLPRGGPLPAISVGGGYRWFGAGDRVADAPYLRLNLSWPEAIHRRLGMELFADHSRTDLRDRRVLLRGTVTGGNTGDPDDDDPSEDPPTDDPSTGESSQTVPTAPSPGASPRVVWRPLEETVTARGDIWQVGAGLRSVLVEGSRGRWRGQVSGRAGVSLTILDFDAARDTAPGGYVGTGVAVSPVERLAVSLDALLHWVGNNDVTEGALLVGTVGLNLTFEF